MDVETDDEFPEGWGDKASSGEMDDMLDQLLCEEEGLDLEEMRAEGGRTRAFSRSLRPISA